MNRRMGHLALLAAALWLTATAAAAQSRPYIGFVYPAGGQQGTTVAIRLGGQNLDGLNRVLVTGKGVTAKVTEYRPRLGNQEHDLIRDQLRELKAAAKRAEPSPEAKEMMARIEMRMAEYVNRPACAAISSIALVEVTIAPDAEPGTRAIRLVARGGATNPLVFLVGQHPEVSRKAMVSAAISVLGKEEQALRSRPPEEVEQTVTLPCTVNGQIASGEVNRYRFEARKGQRLVAVTHARQLVPYVADAVPGWFQPVLRLCDAAGKEVAYDDDFRFKPDPILQCEIPADGQYVLTITDALYRGREDFVYRVTIGETPYLTGIFPLGGQPGSIPAVELQGWNLDGAVLTPPAQDAAPGIYRLTARKGALVTNALPFLVDPLPQCFDKESGDSAAPQEVTLPVIVDGRIDRPDDWDVFRFTGKAGETVVAEVSARRLESPLDSFLKLCDAHGTPLAANDDAPDAGAGTNTHDADSYLSFQLPADGAYTVQLGDTARHGGAEYAYRLRISAPRPDFELRVVPSSLAVRKRAGSQLTVYVCRKDGFAGDVMLRLKDPPAGLSAYPVKLPAGQETVKFSVKADRDAAEEPVEIQIEGKATIRDQVVVRQAVPAEDRMQAFLWRHLVPAENLPVAVLSPNFTPTPARVYTPPPSGTEPPPAPAESPMFSKKQVANRLRELRRLYEAWLLTDEFYGKKVAECEAAM